MTDFARNSRKIYDNVIRNFAVMSCEIVNYTGHDSTIGKCLDFRVKLQTCFDKSHALAKSNGSIFIAKAKSGLDADSDFDGLCKLAFSIVVKPPIGAAQATHS